MKSGEELEEGVQVVQPVFTFIVLLPELLPERLMIRLCLKA